MSEDPRGDAAFDPDDASFGAPVQGHEPTPDESLPAQGETRYDPDEHLRVLRQHRTRRSRAGRGWRRLLTITGFVALVALVVIALALWLNRGEEPQTPALSGPAKEVTIPDGMTADAVARLLESEGIVTSADDFVHEMQAKGVAAELKSGTYTFTPSESADSLLKQLVAGPLDPGVKVTIPEGLSIDQVAARLQVEGKLDGTEYERKAGRPKDFTVPKVGPTVPEVVTLEGLLFPDTYFLSTSDTSTDLIERQLEAFEQRTAALPWGNAKTLGVTPYQAVIVASMIEKEVSVPEEGPKVAAVIYNRLAAKMSVGFDSTVRYALKKWTGPLTKSDLAVDSPYNTRKVLGLPPSPIASPGLAALRAALNPAKTNDLYFVLQATTGRLYFTNNYDDFLNAAKDAPPE